MRGTDTGMRWGALLLGAVLLLPCAAQATDEAPEAFVKRVSVEVLDSIKADKGMRNGDVNRVMVLVDTRIMPNLDFARMTASAVGPAWRQASPEQKARLQEEFKTLLARTYSGALAQVGEQTVDVKPVRGSAEDKELVVRTEIKNGGEIVQMDYRLSKTPGQGAGWKIYNLNVMGVWLVDTYKTQFAQEINAKGLDGLINSLSERNKSNAKK